LIHYRTLEGVELSRADQGERVREVVAALALRPWQTKAELGIVPTTLLRMHRSGRLQRRRRRSEKWSPYEYALPGAE